MTDKAGSMDMMGCNCAALRKATRRVSLLYDRYLARSGLTAGQYSIIDEIARHPDSAAPSLSALAQALVMDRTALSHTLQPLARDGLIRVSTDRRDRRVRLVHLTALGRKRASTAEAAWTQAQEHFSEVFGSHQAIALRALLKMVADTDFGETR